MLSIIFNKVRTRPDIVKTIVEQQGDYLLAVKGNQLTLFDAVRKALAPQLTDPLNQEGVAIEQQHGRIEVREYHVLDAGALAWRFLIVLKIKRKHHLRCVTSSAQRS